jgi:superkiller protein 3
VCYGAVPGEVDQYIQEGKKHIESQQYEEAAESFEKTLRIDGDNDVALFHLGFIYTNYLDDGKRGDYYWRKYKALTFANLGELALKSNDLKSAAEHYEAAVSYMPQDTQCRKRLIAIYEKLGMDGKVTEQYEAIAESEPGNVELRRTLWKALAAAGRHVKAKEYLEDVINARPDDGALRKEAIEYYREQGDAEKAVQHLESASRAAGLEKEEYCRSALLYLSMGRDDEAEKALFRGCGEETRELCSDVTVKIARAYEEKGRLSKAARLYSAALEHGARTPAIYNSLIVAYGNMGKTDEAIRAAESAVREFPENPALLNNCAVLYALGMEYDKAVGMYRRALRVDPKMADAYLDLGIIYKDYLNNRDAAVKAFQEYVRLEPKGKDNPEVKELLGGKKQGVKDGGVLISD